LPGDRRGFVSNVRDGPGPEVRHDARSQIPVLALLLPMVAEVALVLQRRQRRVQKRCRVQKRGRRPSLCGLLLDSDRGSVLAEQKHEEETELRAA
jgi:hypothetical protein